MICSRAGVARNGDNTAGPPHLIPGSFRSGFSGGLAVTEGFEPSVRIYPVQRFSKPPPSATRPRLRPGLLAYNLLEILTFLVRELNHTAPYFSQSLRNFRFQSAAQSHQAYERYDPLPEY